MRSLAEIVSLRTPACQVVAAALPEIAAGEMSPDRSGSEPPTHPADHVAECLRCQAELSAYRRLLEQLKDLRHDEVSPPEGAMSDLLRLLGERPAGVNWAVRAVYVGGITVATAAAGAAGVLVWMNRRRPALASAS